MLEYDYNDTKAKATDSSYSSSDEKVEAKTGHLGFTSEAKERMWMEQVRRECAKGYTDRMR